MLIVVLLFLVVASSVTCFQPIAWLTNALRPEMWFSTPNFLLRSSSNNGQLIRRNELKANIYAVTSSCQPNGLTASVEQQTALKELVNQIELLNPTPNPAYSPLMNGYWRMLYTDFTPAAGMHNLQMTWEHRLFTWHCLTLTSSLHTTCDYITDNLSKQRETWSLCRRRVSRFGCDPIAHSQHTKNQVPPDWWCIDRQSTDERLLHPSPYLMTP